MYFLQPDYENKYNALVEECSLEVAQEICMNNSTHPDTSFNTNKMVNPGLETGLEVLENGCSETQTNNFESIARDVVSSELNTIIETYREVNTKNDETVMEKISEDKIHNGNCNILCLQCQTFYETQEIYENHKIFCVKEENASKRVTLSSTIENKKHSNKVINPELEVESFHTDTKGFEDTDLIDKFESSEPVCGSHYSQSYETEQNFDIRIYPHGSLTENASVGLRCGHCKEVYHNKKDLLNHITQSHEGRLLFGCFTCSKTYEKWSSLDIHEATHRMDKPYLCDLCGKSFKHSNNLRGHKRTHLDESIKKRHVCEVCGNAFRSR